MRRGCEKHKLVFHILFSLTESSKSPVSIAQSNRQWVGVACNIYENFYETIPELTQLHKNQTMF